MAYRSVTSPNFLAASHGVEQCAYQQRTGRIQQSKRQMFARNSSSCSRQPQTDCQPQRL